MKQTGFPRGEYESLSAGPLHPLYPTAEREEKCRAQLVGMYKSIFQNVFSDDERMERGLFFYEQANPLSKLFIVCLYLLSFSMCCFSLHKEQTEAECSSNPHREHFPAAHMH